MLSIIICSINPEYREKIRQNIRETVGVDYEIIVEDNRGKKDGICMVYNRAAEKARFPYLCFIHEDTLITTHNWGGLICTLLSDPATGMVGIAGGDAISNVPATWSVPWISNEISIYQHKRYTSGEPSFVHQTSAAGNQKIKSVVALDGVFMCTRKDVWQRFQFDAETFTGFHGYDVDFSFQVSRYFHIYVTHDIELHHFSEGNPDLTWFESIHLFQQKWKHALPASTHRLTRGQYQEHYWRSLQVLLEHAQRLNLSRMKTMAILMRHTFSRYFHTGHFLYTFRKLLRKKA